jgi:hypothetical protein
VKLLEFVKASKTLVDAGAWTDKRMPKSGGKFPLSKARNFRVGASGWRWRVLEFACSTATVKILATYHAGKRNYLAAVGVPLGSDLLVLGRLENHGTHPGWHVHALCSHVPASSAGRLSHPDMKRPAAGEATNARLPFPSDDVAATEILVRYFKLPALPTETAVQVPLTFSGSVS